ncbi:MAG: hypothetical protein EOP47_25320, partial [Sphingobacteriaceae bacterium]
MQIKFICFSLLVLSACLITTGCKKEDNYRDKDTTLKQADDVSSYTVRATVRKLDAVGDGRYNYEFIFWITSGTDTLNALWLPGPLQLTGKIITGGGTAQKNILLQAGTRVTRQIFELNSPVSIVGKFSVPGSYQGKPIYCNATTVE